MQITLNTYALANLEKFMAANPECESHQHAINLILYIIAARTKQQESK